MTNYIPKVGEECEYHHNPKDGTPKAKCVVRAFDGDDVWVKSDAGGNFVIPLKKIQFIKLKTDQELKRERVVAKGIKALDSTRHYGDAEAQKKIDVEALYDAKLLRDPEEKTVNPLSEDEYHLIVRQYISTDQIHRRLIELGHIIGVSDK